METMNKLFNPQDRLVKLQRDRERDALCGGMEEAVTGLREMLRVDPPWLEEAYTTVVERLEAVAGLLRDGNERVKKVVGEAYQLVEKWQKMEPANTAANKVPSQPACPSSTTETHCFFFFHARD